MCRRLGPGDAHSATAWLQCAQPEPLQAPRCHSDVSYTGTDCWPRPVSGNACITSTVSETDVPLPTGEWCDSSGSIGVIRKSVLHWTHPLDDKHAETRIHSGPFDSDGCRQVWMDFLGQRIFGNLERGEVRWATGDIWHQKIPITKRPCSVEMESLDLLSGKPGCRSRSGHHATIPCHSRKSGVARPSHHRASPAESGRPLHGSTGIEDDKSSDSVHMLKHGKTESGDACVQTSTSALSSNHSAPVQRIVDKCIVQASPPRYREVHGVRETSHSVVHPTGGMAHVRRGRGYLSSGSSCSLASEDIGESSSTSEDALYDRSSGSSTVERPWGGNIPDIAAQWRHGNGTPFQTISEGATHQMAIGSQGSIHLHATS